ncbi:TRK potassium uptake system protein [Halorhabdus tiamatea SARL4B]|uniref:TRK potassium uptake system protein n=1 Tax=Halorhabdus tiamatea SARL4B TaxID=1033806 RepID=F7PQD9_9EURY|nr:TrkA family potassium uptake protein [Halorhabdus tiamatea]ERJ06100.1 TRK potassium uptake system protein [Halorhabdus tiamatea SARL4B]CCQ33270.1 TrkA-N domain protein [Halorhabdus tiamatea SARL4B]
MYIVIVGAGDIGTPLIEIATRSGNEVVVIERDTERANRAADRFDCLVLEADATTNATLEDAGIERADAVVSTTDRDATNVMVCLLAKEYGVPSILSVVHDPEHMNLFEQIGVNTMENPQQLIAEYLYRAVARPAIVDYMRIGDQAEVFEISVTENAPVAGKTLQETADEDLLSDDILIVAIERDGANAPITPRGNTTIHAGDVLTVYSAVGAEPEITDIFGHYEDRVDE